MGDLFMRMWDNLVLRISGPMKFRLVLQPAMALFLGIRAGLKDARDGRSPYFWSMFIVPAERRAMLQGGWKSVGRLFVITIMMDVIYQLIVQRWVYPGEAFVVAIVLAIVPYLLVRGPVNRIARPSRGVDK